eukprot:CAMPEP_0171095754 /NCGR_PEP_ID=MMETSP0766_2-20121228/43355_1 /TAXON_ID=439317 /ORGANISM="Gambierdiscus australes, Strain CAWD 149" /LENGTH=70 /DNA_ID=CAMNT_0011554609 /DNA_START=71 /DNA_END=280 /DNA_ORIENTATION=-
MAKAVVLPLALAACFCAVMLRCALPASGGAPPAAAFVGTHLRGTAAAQPVAAVPAAAIAAIPQVALAAEN